MDKVKARQMSDIDISRVVRLEDRWDQDDVRSLLGHIAWMEAEAELQRKKIIELSEIRTGLITLNQQYVREITSRSYVKHRLDEQNGEGYPTLGAIAVSQQQCSAQSYSSREDMEGHPQNYE